MQDCASHKYSSTDLSNLGIRELSPTDFIGLLRAYLNSNFHHFSQQPATWHSKLAEAILTLSASAVRDLRLVPLRDGSWVAPPSVAKIFFRDMIDGLRCPAGIQVHIIDDSAAMQKSRSSLYSKLGAQRLSSAEVYCLIRDQHRGHGSDFNGWTVESVVAHAWFSFTSPNQPIDHDLRRICVASEDPTRLYVGDELYMNNPEGSFNIREYFGNDNSVVRFIQELYLLQADNLREEAWFRWLRTQLGVRTLPKLWRDGRLTPEFRWIIRSRSSNDWLYLLKDHWVHYSDEFPHYGPQREALANMEVLCKDGTKRPLSNVYLPTTKTLTEPCCEKYVPPLAVDDPEHVGWKQFSRLGLRMVPDLRFYLGILEGLQAGLNHNFRLEDVRRIYEGINIHFSEDPHFVSTFFSSRASIDIASRKPSRWVTLPEARWVSPACLSHLWPLRNRYPDGQGLFLQKLGIKSASGSDVVHELTTLSGRIDHIDIIKQLLFELSGFVESDVSQANMLSPLIHFGLKILPVTLHRRDLRSCVETDEFFTTRERLKRVWSEQLM